MYPQGALEILHAPLGQYISGSVWSVLLYSLHIITQNDHKSLEIPARIIIVGKYKIKATRILIHYFQDYSHLSDIINWSQRIIKLIDIFMSSMICEKVLYVISLFELKFCANVHTFHNIWEWLAGCHVRFIRFWYYCHLFVLCLSKISLLFLMLI